MSTIIVDDLPRDFEPLTANILAEGKSSFVLIFYKSIFLNLCK